MRIILLFILCFILKAGAGFAQQISSIADVKVPTQYSSGEQDMIHVFCSENGELDASLIASYPQGETGNFEWLKYNPATGVFDLYSNDLSGNQTSSISNLADGCYRVKLTTSSVAKTMTAWVFNNSIKATAEITASDCNSFTLKGTVTTPTTLPYVDLTNGQPKFLNKDIKVKWKDGSNTLISSSATFQNFNPPFKNTNYTLEVTDRFGCTGKAEVEYISLVTKASFTYTLEGQEKRSDPNKIEVPLKVKFTNTSENGDPGKYEWFFFKDVYKISNKKDSIEDVVYSDNPVYTYENTGKYMVKLVSKKITGLITCTDTFYMPDYIVADSSFIDAPNVFTPNGDGSNDKFVVKFFSMKTIKITILDRWGKVIHVWESNNVQGFYNTATSVPQSVWDGKIGGQMATPGVYFWVAEGRGRDGRRLKDNGFFHLFRGK
jgi:gliding motility-associated-like protein